MTAAPHPYDAVVVGAGPNGLTAAARLACAGRRVLVLEAGDRIGGSCASDELGGLVRDTCAAIHPFGAASPAFAALRLVEHGLVWAEPPLAVAHPLDGGHAGTLSTDFDTMVTSLGDDGPRYRRIVGPLVDRAAAALDALTGPVLRVPRSLDAATALAVLGAFTPLPATVAGRVLFGRDEHRAVYAGLTAHASIRLDRPFSNAAGFGLLAAGHIGGWPAAQGGSQAIVEALASVVRANGGEIVTGQLVRSRRDVPPASALVLDVTPRQALAMLGDELPSGTRRRARRWRYGDGHCKVDYVLSGPVPWTAEACHHAGTVHLGGTAAEIAAAEAEVASGRLPERPYVLTVQPDVADPTRVAADGRRPFWTYTHVPNGCDVDVSDRIERQLDRFAPGWRDLVVAREVRTSSEAEAHNPNLIGGDISGGSVGGAQLLRRPTLVHPYRLADRVWMCSGSTPPGPGVHGMGGWHAAGDVLATTP